MIFCCVQHLSEPLTFRSVPAIKTLAFRAIKFNKFINGFNAKLSQFGSRAGTIIFTIV